MQQTPTTVTPVSAEERPSRRRRRGLLALLLGLTTISLGAGMFSLAIFTDTDDSTGSFASGDVDIVASPSVSFSVTGMVPGDTQTAALTIQNDGSADFRYALSTVASNTLGDTLTLTVREEDGGGGCTAFTGASVLAATALDGAAFGDPAAGDDGGDRDLLAGDDEVLCFRVELPLATGPALMNATSDATFTFDAEQIDNNP